MQVPLGLVRINEGLDACLYIGNLDSLRDWGHARDYVETQWRLLQQDTPKDFVIATGRQEPVGALSNWPLPNWVGSGI